MKRTGGSWVGTVAAILVAAGISLSFWFPAGKAQGQQASAKTDLSQSAGLGEKALREGRFQEAIPLLERAAKLSPTTAELHADLAFAYYSVGRPEDASREAREALRLNPRLARVRDILGLSLAESGRCGEALPILGKSYAAATDRQMRREIGTSGVRCAMLAQQGAGATDWVERLRRDYPNDPEILYMATHVYSELSTEASQRLLTVAPGSIPAHTLNAEVLESQGRTADAIAEYRKVIAMNPRQPDAHYELGRLLARAAQNGAGRDEARQAFEEELKLDPGNAAAEYQLGDLARQGRQWQEAIQHFERALHLAPKSMEVLLGLAGTLIAQDRFEDAREPLEKAIQYDPENPQAHYMLSTVYRRLGREMDAARELDLYNRAHSSSTESQMNIRRGMAGTGGGGAKTDPPAPPEPHDP